MPLWKTAQKSRSSQMSAMKDAHPASSTSKSLTKLRTRVALKKLAIFWGIALVSVLLPVVHFVLVPLFFFLGFFFAYRGFKSEGQVLSGETTCPHCGTKVVVKKQELAWPITEICQGCARVVRMEREDQAT